MSFRSIRIPLIAPLALLALGAGLSADPQSKAAAAAEPGSGTTKIAASPRPLTEAQSLKFENLILREQLAQQQVDKARAEQQALYGDVCKAAGIEAADCSVDLQKQTVSRRPAETSPADKK